MVERAQLDTYRLANSELARIVKGLLADFFASLDLDRPEHARDVLLEFVPVLVAQYGDVAATMAAEFYEEMRTAQGATGAFTATLAAGVPTGAIEAKVRYLAGHLWTPEPTAMLSPLLVATDKYVKQPGRSTIAANARRENVRYARVPTGDKTCSFCLVLASRDAVYATVKSAGDGKGTGYGDDYHGDCDCQVVRIAKPSDYPESYLPDDYLAKYEAARDAAGSTQIKAVAAAMRREFPDLVRDGVHTHGSSTVLP
ncbi:hypothetical protein [Pseudarthrobacter sp. NamE5]|uniref:VG15 protein n=1 Tax=Pseudarthrobacter sp. NamE5 TaxID=2576839 RepID=UPI00110AA15B|nr:hypothetical protein [Pseudarthrobacter sp. NamE5]TLM87216.1 hypothetical protein FDW84_05320 [Pseudarthrobacter sp. NamE5]